MSAPYFSLLLTDTEAAELDELLQATIDDLATVAAEDEDRPRLARLARVQQRLGATTGAGVLEAVGEGWHRRAQAQGFKPRTAAYKRAEVEFCCGAMTALNAALPHPEAAELLSPFVGPGWTINIMTGRPVFGRARDENRPATPGRRLRRSGR